MTFKFRSHDLLLGYTYEVKEVSSGNECLYVYKNRADQFGIPVFESIVLIYSAFHSPDGEFLIINHGSGSYGSVPVIFRGNRLEPYITENNFRNIMEKFLSSIYPEMKNGNLCHIYSPVRDVQNKKALLYASGDFSFSSTDNRLGQKSFKGLFMALDLESGVMSKVDEKQGLKSWYSGRRNESASGSGCFITSKHVLTNAHVVGDSKKVVVGLGNRETWGDVIAVSQEYDLALLTIPCNSLIGVPIPLSEKPKLGQRIRAFGYPLPMYQGYSLKVTEGIISGLFGLMDDPLQFQISAPIQPGNSGGAVIDENNELAGITVASLNKASIEKTTGSFPENVNFAIHIDIVRAFLGQQNISLGSSISDRKIFDPERSCVQISVHE